jgi:hypothetical protein
MGTQKKKKGLLKSEARKKAERVLRGLGFTPHSSGALRGDVRDAERFAYLGEIFKDAEIPKFLTVPMSKWCAFPPRLDQRARFSIVRRVAFRVFPARLPRIRRASGDSSG